MFSSQFIHNAYKGLLCSLFSLLLPFAISAQSFTDVALDAGINFVPIGGANYNGVAVLDYNNDGFEDLYIAGGGAMDGLFKNNGDGTFSDVSIQAGIGFTSEFMTSAVAAGDIDNDGFRDIFVSTLVHTSDPLKWARNILLYNNGDGTFSDITDASNIGRDSVNSGPVNFGDVNNDGYLDIYVCNYMSNTPDELYSSGQFSWDSIKSEPNNLYINNGDNTFTEIAQLGILGDSGLALAAAFFDFNNDANIDLYVANDDTAFPLDDDFTNSLFKNTSPEDARFSDVGPQTGTDALNTSMGIAVGDYDGNGYLDMYITYCGINTLYRNNGDETFTDVAVESGLADEDVPVNPANNKRKTLLYRYTPDTGFTGLDTSSFKMCFEEADTSFCVEYEFTINVMEEIIDPIPIQFWDINSGQVNVFDILNPNIIYLERAYLEVEANTSTLICMELFDNMTFESYFASANGSEEVEVDSTILPSSGWGANFLDFDHDRDLDLFVANGHETVDGPMGDNPNSFYRNEDNGLFTNISEISGVMSPWSARGSVLTDYDNDGDEDIFVVNIRYADEFGSPDYPRALLFRNNLVLDGFNNWLKVKLNGTESNRDGIGAMVKTYIGFNTLIRQIDGGSSAMSHNSIIAHFGLGAYNKVDSLEIIWPGGCSQKVYDIDDNQLINITQDCEEIQIPTTSESSILNELMPQVSVYPVPSSQTIAFTFDLDIPKVVKIRIIDNQGRQQFTTYMGLAIGGQPIDLDISSLSSGTYFYTISCNGHTYSDQIVVVR